VQNHSLWYKDAIIYEVHVRAFYDSDGNGIGDFNGLIQKLDYLKDLGINTLWLLPFYPSPLKDDGYDIASYNAVNPSYGTINDFKNFMKEAHKRDLRVITELVINHTSDQHPWFQRARNSKPGSRYRNFYVWSDTTDKYSDARIIFQDFEPSNWSWDRVAQAYYWHRFFSHQPDLNFENPEVHDALFQVLNFWLKMGVNGLRLDAIPYLYEAEGTNCENLPQTHEFLKKLRAYVDKNFKDVMLLAEANQWPEDSVNYFGDGDECHMAFHFPLMPRLFMAVQMENRFPIIDILDQTPPIPENCQWAVFLRNHDELTLEMVTDEERDYMYRVYAHDPRARINLGIRRRLAPLMGNDRRKIELMNGLLFSMPGTPVIYYGDELGMGDNIYLGDRNGVRTPMQWSPDRNAGFSKANPQQLYLPVIIDPEYHYETINVEALRNNPNSLLWWMKRLIGIRKQYKALSRGSIEFLHPENRKVLSFVRKYEDETILVVANLSRHLQYVEMDLSRYRGMVPVEVAGRTDFPPIGDLPYFFTLAPYAYYWFSLEIHKTAEGVPQALSSPDQLPVLNVRDKWDTVFTGRNKTEFEKILHNFVVQSRWFGGKARKIKNIEIRDIVRLKHSEISTLLLIQIEYADEDPDLYVLALSYATGQRAEDLRNYHLKSVVTNLHIRSREEDGVLYESFLDHDFCAHLLESMQKRRRFRGNQGELVFSPTRIFRDLIREEGSLEPYASRAEQSNTSIVYGERFILKIYRRLEAGINPDLEIGNFLTENRFAHTPPIAGSIDYQPTGRGNVMTISLLQGFVTNEGDAWQYTLDTLDDYFEHVQITGAEIEPEIFTIQKLLELVDREPPFSHELLGPYLQFAYVIGHRTAEMHVLLARPGSGPDFEPEAFSTLYQRSLFQSQRALTNQTFLLLRRQVKDLPEKLKEQGQQILSLREEIFNRFKKLLGGKIQAKRIRCHGDYHLGQILYTGKDFVIIDFEGEPARPISERRLKRSPLRDVAGMLRSFHYAAYAALFNRFRSGVINEEEYLTQENWAKFWNLWVSVVFLKGYLEIAGKQEFLPQEREQLQTLLECYLLEKAIYEIGYEMNNRPDWLRIPFQGILQILQEEQKTAT
jgi:maltose alpha-D-glucosyltransferase/alpha-amylase